MATTAEKIPINIVTELEHLTLNIPYKSDGVYLGDNLELHLIPDKDFYCPEPPYVTYNDSESGQVKKEYFAFSGWYWYMQFSTANFATPVLNIYGVAEKIQIMPFVQIFKMNDEELQNLANKRYLYDRNNGTIDITDKGNFIISVRKYFLDIPADRKNPVFLGNYNTNITAYSISYPIMDINGGSLLVPDGVSQYDYTVNKYSLILPFCTTTDLNGEDIIGKELFLKYSINLYAGTCKAVLYTKEGDNINYISIVNGSPCINIPYVNSFSSNNMTELDNITLPIETPNIQVKSYTPIQDSNDKPNNKTAPLKEFSGFIQGDIISLSIVLTNEEHEELERLFHEGVYNRV